jgi:hypothetical protein
MRMVMKFQMMAESSAAMMT